MLSANWVVGVAGAAVILLATGGLLEIEARAGPYDEQLVAVALTIDASGSYRASPATGTIGPGGVCVPAAPGGGCEAARMEVDLRLRGLPLLARQARYVGFVLGASTDPIALGTLMARGEEHSVRFQESRDGSAYTQIVVVLEGQENAREPGPWVVYERDVGGQGRSQPMDLAGSSAASVAPGSGRVRVAEIGMLGKSATAVGHLTAPSPPLGWVYHAWFVSADRTSHVDLGDWAVAEDGRGLARLDARVERVRLEDQGRFLTTLEPPGPVGAEPGGVPVFEALF